MSGLLFVVTAPSGAGKTSLIDALMREDPSLKFSVSYTTRAPRPGEKDGVDYHFVDDATFLAMRARGEVAEDVIQRRMQNAREELSHAGEFKYAIINNHFDNARQQLADIIRTERKKHGPHHR